MPFNPFSDEHLPWVCPLMSERCSNFVPTPSPTPAPAPPPIVLNNQEPNYFATAASSFLGGLLGGYAGSSGNLNPAYDILSRNGDDLQVQEWTRGGKYRNPRYDQDERMEDTSMINNGYWMPDYFDSEDPRERYSNSSRHSNSSNDEDVPIHKYRRHNKACKNYTSKRVAHSG
jgi:hypothetical protein